MNQLFDAIRFSETQRVQQLLNSGVDCNSPRHEYYTYEREWSPLIMAIVYEQPEMLQALIQAGADCKCFYNLDSYKESLINPAIKAKLSDLNVSCTALHTAVRFDNAAIVQILLDAGAFVDEGDSEQTPLDLAVCQQNPTIIWQLLNAGSDVNWDMEDRAHVVMTAAATGNLEVVKILVNAGAELDVWSQGESALSFAAQGGHEDV